MNSRLIRIPALAFPLLLLLSIGAQALDIGITFPDLAASAAIVVEGRITLDQGEPYLVPGTFVKGSANGRMLLGTRLLGASPAPMFYEGEPVLLFLEPADGSGRYYLYGLGDMGKWPQPSLPNAYGRADLRGLVSATEAVVKAFARSSFEERATDIIGMFQSKDEVMQLAGLDMAMSNTFSNSLPEDQKHTARRQLAAFAIPLLQSPRSDIRGHAVLLMQSAPDIVSTPLLIPMVNDENHWVRRQARTILGWAIVNGNIRDEARIQKELPRIRKGLESSSKLEREAATLYLEQLGVSDR